MSNLAAHYKSQGQYGKAESLFATCLEQRRIALGDSHSLTLDSIYNLAVLYDSHGQYEKAEPLLTDCLRKREVVLGVDHPHTIDTRTKLNTVRWFVGSSR
jgi:tetratricopeptide (TPR) repeat protein